MLSGAQTLTGVGGDLILDKHYYGLCVKITSTAMRVALLRCIPTLHPHLLEDVLKTH
jgi:hypothetical protein